MQMAGPGGLLAPKLFSVIRGGYALADLRADAVAGLTVAIVALPLSMALGIASGAGPREGLLTAIIAGFLISATGGSRVQIGGPTGAFVVVVAGIIATHGYAGLLLATLLAGVILIVAGYARLGGLLRYIPQPVITGFTAGIAVIIAVSQLGDLLGLGIKTPADFIDKLAVYGAALGGMQPAAMAVGFGSLAVIFGLRRWAPRVPGFLVVIVVAAAAVTLLGLPVETIGSRFGGISASLPVFAVPPISIATLQAILPSAFTIAFLAGIEALLSATVSDGMAGTHHRSNQELVGNGIANIASALFGGLPATGAIARTATNVRAGARTPVAGMLHALLVLALVFLAGRWLALVPMAALAAILLAVAWGMSEHDKLRLLPRMARGDAALLLLTMGLTVLVDLTAAIGVGVTLASMLFMRRMSAEMAVASGHEAAIPEEDEEMAPRQRQGLPDGVEVFRINGPVFFAVAGEVIETLRRSGGSPRVLILRLRFVTFLDAAGGDALLEVIDEATAGGARVILAGLQPQPLAVLLRQRPGLLEAVETAIDYPAALHAAA
jgi:SulP family sulfate permease